MIAPGAGGGKSLSQEPFAGSLTNTAFFQRGGEPPLSLGGCGIFDQQNHGFVRPIIKRPYFGQAHAKLNCDLTHRCLRARSGSHSGFLSPPAPRGVDGSGQSSRTVQSPVMLKAGSSPAFFLVAYLVSRFACGGKLRRRRSATRQRNHVSDRRLPARSLVWSAAQPARRRHRE
jgi:hypothetical protein